MLPRLLNPILILQFSRPVIFGYILKFTWASLKLEAKLIHLAYIFGSTCPDCCSPNYCLAATCCWEKDHIMLCSLCSSAVSTRCFLFQSLLHICYAVVSWSKMFKIPPVHFFAAMVHGFTTCNSMPHWFSAIQFFCLFSHRSPNLVHFIPRQHFKACAQYEGCCKVWVP